MLNSCRIIPTNCHAWVAINVDPDQMLREAMSIRAMMIGESINNYYKKLLARHRR